MTEPTSETVVDAPTTSRRGRPRPDVTIQRDASVLENVVGPVTREDLVAATGLTANQVYLSLFRLRKDGRVQRERQGAKHVWSRVPEESAVV